MTSLSLHLLLHQEYKVSSFEQRLISEIEFRLERSPVEESDDDVQHDEDSAGQGVAPSFNQKLKHYKVFEGMPVTFSCKVSGDPKPKVRADITPEGLSVEKPLLISFKNHLATSKTSLCPVIGVKIEQR